MTKKKVCIPLCAELHEREEAVRRLQNKVRADVNGRAKVSVTSLMAAMAADVVVAMGKRCLLVLDVHFAVGPVFATLKAVLDGNGQRLVHVVTKAKSNVE